MSKTPDRLAAAIAGSLGADLKQICGTFVELQDERHAADYNLENDPSEAWARLKVSSAHDAFDAFARIAAEPSTHGFLLALLLSEQWTRGG